LGQTVIITTGTFLRGLLHVGFDQTSGGRAGESAASGLSGSLTELGFELGRLKTGTPPRLLGRTIDFQSTEEQLGDEPVPYFSFWKDELFHVEQSDPHLYPPNSILARAGGQLPCYITHTTDRTATLIRANLDKSPLYGGVIKGVGPRYCPSIEDKIVRFADKPRHQIFLEPEGTETEEIYVNGFSTSLPFEIQIQLVRTIVGCESAEIMRPAYAVEYDFVFPQQIQASLETKTVANLYLAGQINGTSGYEEAAAQGLIAGINAARRIQQKPPIILRRDQAYIGVLIDDLVTKGTSEPYRMFTSRAEYRLLLRHDNADIRLAEIGYELGLLNRVRLETVIRKKAAIDSELLRLRSTRHGSVTLEEILRRPEITYRQLPNPVAELPVVVAQQVEVHVKYAGYVQRQETEVRQALNMESKIIPAGFDYSTVKGLRTETRLKLHGIQPRTLGQAARISGITPADISLLNVWLKRFKANSSQQPNLVGN
jgi:tRNA uridine 5-carboxymethylaminomethyl modification enzyme